MSEDLNKPPTPASMPRPELLQGPGGSSLEYVRGNRVVTPEGAYVEPDVFKLDFIMVPMAFERSGIGTALLEEAIDLARDNGFSYIRSGIIDPRAVKMVERQLTNGKVKKSVYVIPEDNAPKPGTSTPELVESKEAVTPDQAQAFLVDQELRFRDAERVGQDTTPYRNGVDCVMVL